MSVTVASGTCDTFFNFVDKAGLLSAVEQFELDLRDKGFLTDSDPFLLDSFQESGFAEIFILVYETDGEEYFVVGMAKMFQDEGYYVLKDIMLNVEDIPLEVTVFNEILCGAFYIVKGRASIIKVYVVDNWNEVVCSVLCDYGGTKSSGWYDVPVGGGKDSVVIRGRF